jgi:transcriptional regulator
MDEIAMYTPDSFGIASVAECHAVMRAHSFATLVTTVAGRAPAITHLPVIVDACAGEFGTLRGHLARANNHWREFATGESTVAIFQGPHGYISPRWYAATVAVPTWNYVAVHAHGQPEIIDDPAAIRLHLGELAERYETGPYRWRIEDLPNISYQTLTASIVCFSMPIKHLFGKAKLSQNRSAEDRLGVIAGLEALGTLAGRQLADGVRHGSSPLEA